MTTTTESLALRGIKADADDVESIQLRIDKALPAHSAGKIMYDSVSKGPVFDIGFDSVRFNAGFEEYIKVHNGTGVTIPNGSPVSATGAIVSDTPSVVVSSSLILLNILGFAGIATMDIPDGTAGLATVRGCVNGIDTSALSLGFIYLDTDGTFTNERPLFPAERLVVGGVEKAGTTDGVISVQPYRIQRTNIQRAYGFTSANVDKGQYTKAGYYDWALTSEALTQANTSVNFGTADQTYAAHLGVVPEAAGVVDTGVVGLRVVGIEDSETGAQVAAQTGIISEDITTLTADVMAETSEKFSGQVLLELYVVSGTPVNYSLTLNYGYSKYEDFNNSNVTVTGFECVWYARKTDTQFDIELIPHISTGWTYAAAAFLPGSAPLVQKSVDQMLAGNVVRNSYGAYKRIGLTEFVEGSGSNGIVIRITQVDEKDAIQTMDINIFGVSEEL